MGLRHEVTYIRNPVELGELYEIVDTHRCWLGAMERNDARWVINQVETATGEKFTGEQANHLIELTGGYPALLRAASLWRANMRPVKETDKWQTLLMAESSIQNRLEDLRHGLTGEEEAALSVLQKAWMIEDKKGRRESLRQIADKYAPVMKRLGLKRLCRETDEGWQLFAGLFAEFVAGMEGISAGKIRHDTTTERFYLGETELSSLSERDDLIEAAWPEDEGEGVSNEAVQQAIRHLRKQIEPNPAKPCYIITERGAGYRFFAEGAPRG
jgi:hypothetical protein